jgi:CheY-like chemotaxis protein
MDIQMPVMDGLEAVRLLRTDPAYTANAGIPVIAMTAYAMSEDRERFLESGMDDYVSKPVSVKALQAAILRVMGATPQE